jgi:tetratricopeptide (TPR) repeat protein
MKEGHAISGKMDEAMDAGTEAFQAHKFDEAERSYKEAVKLGEQLQPHEARLVMSLGYLGSMYFSRKDYPDAQATFERQLKVAEEVYGPASPQTIPVLESLTRLAMAEEKWESAESFAQQEFHLSEKNAGTDNMSYSIGLMSVGYVYFMEKKYEEAKPYVEKAVKIHEQLTGPQAITLVSSKSILCIIYDSLGQSAASEKCNRDLIKVMEPLYGKNNAALVSPLTREARALRGLSRDAEASEIERRIQALHQLVAGSH